MKLRSGDDFRNCSSTERVVLAKRKLGSKGRRCFMRLPFTSLYVV